MDRELPELALKAKYKAQAHSWKELPGNEKGQGHSPRCVQPVLLGARVGRVEGTGRKEDPFLHL